MLDKLSHYYLTEHSHEAALSMGQMEAEEIKAVLDALDFKTRGIILADLTREDTLAYLDSLPAETCLKIFKASPLQSTIRMFIEMPKMQRQEFLAKLPNTLRLKVESATLYDDSCVGSYVDVNVLSIPETFTVKLAKQVVRDNPSELLHVLYVVDSNHKLIGYVDTKALLVSDDNAGISQLLKRDVIFLPATAKLSRVHLHPAWGRLNHLPVVNQKMQFLGVLNHKELRPGMLRKESYTEYFVEALIIVVKTLEDSLSGLVTQGFEKERRKP